MRVTSNIPGLEDALRKAPAKFDAAFDRLASRAAGEVANRAKNEAPAADGVLANSINSARITLGQWIAGTGKEYARDVEDGTKGGEVVPVQTLQAWIKRKGIVSRHPAVDQDGLALLIQRSIFWKGTKANPFMRRTGIAMQPRIQNIFEVGLKTVIDEVLQP